MKYTKIDKQGNITTNECPACDGEGIDFLDWTNARGGSVQFQICGLCDGKGTAIKDIDYEIVSVSDRYGNSGIDYNKLNKGE